MSHNVIMQQIDANTDFNFCLVDEIILCILPFQAGKVLHLSYKLTRFSYLHRRRMSVGQVAIHR